MACFRVCSCKLLGENNARQEAREVFVQSSGFIHIGAKIKIGRDGCIPYPAIFLAFCLYTVDRSALLLVNKVNVCVVSDCDV